MIGVFLHLLALAPAAMATRATSAALWLLCRVPQGSEVEKLGAECDALREERDLARLEFSAAGEVVRELRASLTTARAERAEALRENERLAAQLAELQAAVRRLSLAQTSAEAEAAWLALEAALPATEVRS